jgi:hypothetical membrane protein
MTVFAQSRRATLIASALASASMISYPGGTLLDHDTQHYQIFQNFLSDLGMTVAYDGRTNTIGATLFVASLTLLVVGLGGALFGFVRLYASPRARRLVRGAQIVGGVVALSFLGVAATPENRVLDLHVQLTFFAFRVFPIVPLLLAVASVRDERISRRLATGWIAMTVVLAAYAAMLGWGPSVTTFAGLTTQVVAQKLVTILVISILFVQSIEGDRLLTRSQVIA